MTRRRVALWPALSGVVAGVLALVVAIVLTVGGWSPSRFAMGLIVVGLGLIGGVNLRVASRALAPRVIRALSEEQDR